MEKLETFTFPYIVAFLCVVIFPFTCNSPPIYDVPSDFIPSIIFDSESIVTFTYSGLSIYFPTFESHLSSL